MLLYCLLSVAITLILFSIITCLCVYIRTRKSSEDSYLELDDETPLTGPFTPSINYAQRKADIDIENKVVEKTSIGKLLITKLYPTWSYHTYECVQKRSYSTIPYTIIYGTNDFTTVHYQIRNDSKGEGIEHPIVNMFNIYYSLRHRGIAPLVFSLSDPGPHEASGQNTFEDRFLVLEAVGDRFMDRFSYGKIQTPEMLRSFLLGLIDAVDLIQKLHAEGYYTRNIHIGSFVYITMGDKLVLWDLCCAIKGTMEEASIYYNDDLSVIISLIHNGLQSGNVYRNTRVVSDELKKTFSSIYRTAMQVEGEPQYEAIKEMLRKHL